MYLRLGKTKINYLSPSIDDFIILAEVVDSDMSFEKPVFVRTVDELVLWFGKDFKDYDYLKELIGQGNVLYLFKPINESNNWRNDFIAYHRFRDIEGEYYRPSELPKVGESDKIYKVINFDGNGRFTKDDLNFDKIIWIQEINDFVNIDDLPQNIETRESISTLNRDTLRICHRESKIKYCNPIYGQKENIEENGESLLSVKPSLRNLQLDLIEKGYQTLAFKVTYDENIVPNKDSYLVIQSKESGERTILYFGNTVPSEKIVESKYYNTQKKVTDYRDLFEKLKAFGFSIEGNKIIAPFPIQSTYFYNIEGFSLVPDKKTTNFILDVLSVGDARIEFWSKTIGSGGIDGDIKIKIENTGNNFYRVTVNRFDIQEIHEGYSETDQVDERLDTVINKNSKIIYCRLIQSFLGSWLNTRNDKTLEYPAVYSSDPSNNEDYMVLQNPRDHRIPEGTWILRGSEVEKSVSFDAALNTLLSNSDTLYLDYLMLPNPSSYESSQVKVDEHYKLYDDLLVKLKEINCQALIENSDSTIEGNKLDDRNNYLLYFYGSMEVSNRYRPGYYTYLRGILENKYSYSTTDILYRTPMDGKKLYGDSKLIQDRYKSNYMIDNGLYYYYPAYLDGDSYITSGIMRFCLGKIQRELEKNKWSYLSLRSTGPIRSTIEGILRKIADRFSVIRQILIRDFRIDSRNSKLELKIDTIISDLVKNEISLDVTINYNKTI
jgi:hypothetical protein